MQYHTAYFWQDSKRNLSSLALQQVYCKRKKLPMVFACLGRAEGVAALMDWFYIRGLRCCVKKGGRGIDQAGRSIYHRLAAQHSHVPLVGILGVGKRLCIFNLGNASVRVLNLKKGAAYSRELQLGGRDKYGIGIQYVLMEPEVGVMLGTEGFWKGIAELCVEECLNVKELDGKIRVEKRLQELGKQGELRGGTNMAAVLLVTR